VIEITVWVRHAVQAQGVYEIIKAAVAAGHLILLCCGLKAGKIEGRVGYVIDLADGACLRRPAPSIFWLDLATLLRSSDQAEQDSSRSAPLLVVRAPASA